MELVGKLDTDILEELSDKLMTFQELYHTEGPIMQLEYKKLCDEDIYKLAIYLHSFARSDFVRNRSHDMLYYLMSREYIPAFLFAVARPWIGQIDMEITCKFITNILQSNDENLIVKLIHSLRNRPYVLSFLQVPSK